MWDNNSSSEEENRWIKVQIKHYRNEGKVAIKVNGREEDINGVREGGNKEETSVSI